MTKRGFTSFILLCLLTALLTGCGRPRQQLNVFFWTDYIDLKVVADFEKEFNCQVSIDRYDNPEYMLAKMAGGGASIYDIVVPSNTSLPIMVKRGLLAPLRHENIPNLKNIAPEFANPFFDPGHRYGVPYHWSTTGLFVRRSKENPVTESWSLIFDPAKQPGPFLLISDVRACIGAALRYKGHSSNSTNLTELAEARDLIIDARNRSLGFESSLGGKNRVLAKGAVAAMTYTEVQGTEEDPETHYFVPREGTEISLDEISIPAGAPHRDLAEQFINYLLDARVAAKNANSIRNATANQAALEFINPADRNNPAIYPPPDIRRVLEYNRDLGDFNKLYDEIWTQIKSR